MALDFLISVDTRDAIKAMLGLNKAIDDTAKRSARALKQPRDELGRFIATGIKARKELGALDALKFAGANVAISTLTDLFRELAAAATQAFIDITKEAIALNSEAELTKLALTQIFEGNEKAADAFVKTVGDLAIKLGTSRQELTGLAKGILPDVGDVTGTIALLENVIVLGRDAGQGIDSIRIATEEALSGNLSSLQRRLNIPKTVIDNIKEYQKEMSLADAINKALGERIQQTGISADITAESFAVLQGAILGNLEGFQRLLGEAPFEELKEQALGFLQVLKDQNEGIEDAALAVGELAADVIEFVGSGLTDFIASIDFEAVDELAVSLQEAVAATRLLFKIFATFLPATEDTLQSVTGDIDKITVSLVRAAVTANQLRDGLVAAFLALKATVQLQQLDFAGALETGKELFSAETFGTEALADRANEMTEAFKQFNQQLEDINDTQKERKKATEDTTEADLAAGDAIRKRIKAEEDAAKAALDAAEAQEEINKKLADAEEDRAKRLTDLLRKEADRRIDDARKAAQEREDIARDNAEAIEDIFRDNEDALEDASTDLSREEADIARKGARERRDIEIDAANERIEIEKDFRRELERIQNDFLQTAEEAERNNDAQAFLRASRARDDQIAEAAISRDESLEDVSARAQTQREELQRQLAQEVEDARIANAQKLEDLRLRLDRELEEQAIKNQRDLEEQAIKEQRLAEQRDIAIARDLEALERSETEKQAKLQESLTKQFELIETAKMKELELTARVEAEKTRIVQEQARQRALALTGSPLDPSGPRLGGEIEGFQEGGQVQRNRAIIVGERGPEVFVPQSAGTIIPNQAIFSPPARGGFESLRGASSITNNSPTFNLAESMFSDPIARRNLTNFVLGVLAESA
jgi:hypothetical protein